MTRTVTNRKTNKMHAEVVYAVTSLASTGIGPQVITTLRNTALSFPRLNGHDNIAKALRHNARSPHRQLLAGWLSWAKDSHTPEFLKERPPSTDTATCC